MSARLRGLYAITSDELARDPPRLLAAVAGALDGGAAIVQYRDKHGAPAQRRDVAARLLELCRRRGVPLVINDDLELAAALGADGVHVGGADAAVELARAHLGSRAIVGRSCAGSVDAARAAERSGASYVAFGRFFPSRTKPQAPQAQLEVLARAHQELEIPVCAIGGITPENAAAVIAAGADLVAAVDGIFGAPDVAAAARRYSRLFTAAE